MSDAEDIGKSLTTIIDIKEMHAFTSKGMNSEIANLNQKRASYVK